MTEVYRVRYEPLAREALREAVSYIQEHSGSERARAWLRALLESVDSLEALPKAYSIVTTRGGEDVYSKLVAPYRVFYVVDDAKATVHVVDVVHTARETRLAQYRKPTE